MTLKHFTFDEFDSPDLPGSGQKMDREFLQMLDKARTIAGVSFRINSGYRTKSHNAKVGGVPASSHLKGCACDISAPTSRERYHIVRGLMAAGFNRIGIGATFVHVDNDEAKSGDVIWHYY